MRNVLLRNVRLVSSIKEKYRLMLVRVIDPTRELLASCHRPSWIVRKAKINQIDVLLWWIGHEIIFGRAGQIDDSFVAPVLPAVAGVTSHHVRVDVNRIHRIGNGHLVLIPENVENVT